MRYTWVDLDHWRFHLAREGEHRTVCGRPFTDEQVAEMKPGYRPLCRGCGDRVADEMEQARSMVPELELRAIWGDR